jgi:glycosyltransferase involved in cell wall biosynthesis
MARAELDAKLESIRARTSLRVIYAGRAVAMKGAIDWVEAMIEAIAGGADIDATWIGDGDQLPGMKSRVESMRLSNRIRFEPFIHDRSRLLDQLRQADVLVFCHHTPESPRVLIESLVSGTPIVGYASAYACDLLKAHAGGALVQKHEPHAIARTLIDLARDRLTLATLTEAAWHAGAPFNDEAVFAHRSELIERYG